MTQPAPTWMDPLFAPNARGKTRAAFTMPAVDASVAVQVDLTDWMVVGQGIFIEGAGALIVASIDSQKACHLTNPGTTGNAPPATIVALGAAVTAAGVPGARGEPGAAGYPGTTATVNPAVGDVASSANVDTAGKVAKASAARKLAVGIVTVAAAGLGADATLQTTGLVPAVKTSGELAGSGLGDVILDPTTGRATRTTNYQPGRDWKLGVADDEGNLALGACNSVSTAHVAVKDVRLKGAAIDGTTDDVAAINAAIADVAGAESHVVFPPGTSAVHGPLTVGAIDSLKIKGAGMGVSIVKATAANFTWFTTSPRKSLVVEDMTFDGAGGYVVWFLLNLQSSTKVVFRRVEFVDFAEGLALLVQRGRGVILEDCVIDGKGVGLGTGVSINGPGGAVKVIRTKFRALTTGIVGAPDDHNTQTSSVVVDDCEFDMGYYTLPTAILSGTAQSGSGAGVSYTASTCVDSGRDFSTWFPGGNARYNYVRALGVRKSDGSVAASGTSATASAVTGTTLTIASGDYTAFNLIVDEFVRMGGAQARIIGISISKLVLYLAGWTDLTTYQPCEPPTAGTFVICAVFLGEPLSAGGTGNHTLTVQQGWWHDLNGVARTPPAQCLYEAIPAVGYALHMSDGVNDVKIHKTEFFGSWGDQCSLFCDEYEVAGCSFRRGHDQAITANGRYVSTVDYLGRSTVHDNRIIFGGGRGGIFAGRLCDGIVHDNVIIGGPTNINPAGAAAISGYAIQMTGVHASAHHNTVDGLGLACATSGIQCVSAIAARIADNDIYGLASGAPEVWVYDGLGSVSEDVQVRHNGPIAHTVPSGCQLAPAGIYEIRGPSTGAAKYTPRGTQFGDIGSEWVSKITGDVWRKTGGTGLTNDEWTKTFGDFNPRDLPNITARYVAADYASGTWTDTSGNGYDATTAGSNPALVTNQVNGKGVVRFGAGNKLALPAALEVSGALTVWCVTKTTDGSHDIAIVTLAPVGGGPGLYARLNGAAGKWGYYAGANRAASVTDAVYKQLTYLLPSSALADATLITGKGVAVDTISPRGAYDEISLLYIGADGVGGANGNLDIAELIIFKGTVLGAADYAALQQYGVDTYGVA